jgi:hypothetical protein
MVEPPPEDMSLILDALERGPVQPGEDASSDSPEAAARWVARYRELLAYNAALLHIAGSAAHRHSAGAAGRASTS